jgi:hypothetical protein
MCPENNNQSNQKFSLARLLGSTSLILTSLIVAGVLSILSVPPKSLDPVDGIPTKYKVLVSKLSSFLASKEQPDVVIIGSSLVLMPAARCDDRLSGKLDCYDDWYYYKHIPEYTQARYLEHMFAKTGFPVKIKNLGVASSIMSDHTAVLKTILTGGKKPGLVICGIAPRDFLDNSQQHFKDTPTQIFLREYNAHGSILPASLAKTDLEHWYTYSEHQFKKVLARIKDTSADFMCELTNHPAALQHVRTKETAYMESKPNLLKDLETYRKLYNPPNFKMLEQQKQYLQEFLAVAKKNNVEVLLVNMPLTKENTSSLNSSAHQAYLKTIAEVARANKVELVDIGSSSPDYSNADFEDCCHLNAAGGQKLFATVFDSLIRNQTLASDKSEFQANQTQVTRSVAAVSSPQ